MKNTLQNQKNLILAISSLALFVGCAPNKSASVEKASQSISNTLGCANLQSKVYDSFYELIDSSESIPLAGDLKQSLKTKLNTLKSEKSLTSAESAKLDQISDKLSEVVDLMLAEAAKNPNLTNKDLIQKLIEFEMEDQSSPEIVQTSSKLKSSLKQVSELSDELPVSCQTADLEASMPTVAAAKAKASVGLNLVFATAYQSCRVLDLPPMDASTPSVVGITRNGTHADGIGGKRYVTDLKSVQNTHYYIRGIASASSCVQVRNNPLIYDYGGKVATSGNTLSFFKNAGSGTTALGVDCSGYVAAGIAAAGLRYKPGLVNKTIYANQGASKYISASKSGFTCFDNVTVTPTESIREGDIVGVSGHVVAVDKLGADPFGLNNVTSEAGCSKLDYRKFDIVVSQSSPSKNGIGMNKFKASVYLAETGKMQTAFVEMGKSACLAKFQKKNIKPASSAWGFVRHKGTAECIAPRALIEGESCVQSCLQ